ncbi:hypothetical protein [Nocardia sp. NPDC020380]|uniref:hypothetical protein n=1 Tax=Nocardia sp. NPDC020380 TaxID=3364309 RepID=UPI00379D4FD8
MAWFWTEGCINGSGAISICQSLEVNPQNCADIRTALTRHLGPAFDGDMRGIKGPETLTDRHVAAWKESLHKGSEVIYFFLNKAASRPLLDHVDSEKKVSLGFLRDLTDAQLLLYVDVSMRADGNPAKLRLAQTSKARAEAFQYAAILAGYATTIHHVDNDHHSSAPESRHRDQWEVGLIRSGRVSPVAHATNKDGRPFAVEQTTYDGQVWCPTVPSGTWLARRNGTVYWTGDTDGTAWSRRDSPS